MRKGLNVIVGENASGKTAIIDAIRLLLREDEFGHSPVTESDFHRPFDLSPNQAIQEAKQKGEPLPLEKEVHEFNCFFQTPARLCNVDCIFHLI
ncbi:MAG: ATP-binding protein [Deltaproteobacteria bacterium]|nr:ATP-binding protein [Deltaproteobacteria bacterium]